MLSHLTRSFLPFAIGRGSRLRQVAIACTLALGSLAAPTASVHADPLPSLGGAGEMSLAQERKIGDSIAKQLYRDPDLLDDPLLQNYVDGIFSAIVAAARERGELDADMAERFAWKAFIGKDRTVNAFALPGGFFGIHAGMLKVSASRDEFASVVAHEVSHVTQRHISRSMAKQAEQGPLIMAATILGIIAASRSGSADALAATAYGSQAASAQLQLNYSRDMEREADRVGFNVLSQAGFVPDGMRLMFERLQQATRLVDSGQFPYLRSHPLNSERIAEIQARTQLDAPQAVVSMRAPTVAAGNASMRHAMARDPGISPAMHNLMSSRAKVLADNSLDQLRILTQEGSAAHLDTLSAEKRPAALYTAMLAQQRLREYDAALATHMQLRALLPDDPAARMVLLIARNEILRDQAIAFNATANWRAVSDSAEPLARAELLSRPALMAWAATQISAQQAPQAVERLQLWVADHPQDSYAWRMLSKAYEGQGRMLRSLEAVAQAHRVEGDLRGALDRLQSAQRLARGTPTDHIDASIIDTKAREIQSALREQAVQDRFNRQLAYGVNQRAHQRGQKTSHVKTVQH